MTLALALAAAWAGRAFAAEHDALNVKAWVAFQARDFAATETLARQAWSAAEAAGSRPQAGVAAANVAAALAIRGRFGDALEWSGRADDRLSSAGLEKPRGRAAAARALIHHASGDRRAGDSEFARAAGALGAGDWRLAFLRTLVKLYADLDFSTVYDDLTALLARAPGEQDRASCRIALGWVASFFGGPALEHFDEARRLARASGDPETRLYAERNRAVALLRGRDLAAAERALGDSLKEARGQGDRRLQVILLNDLSLLRVQKGEDALARQADLEVEALLGSVADDLRARPDDDTVLLDFRQLSKLRYVHLAPVLYPLFRGLFDQLAVDPRAAGAE